MSKEKNEAWGDGQYIPKRTTCCITQQKAELILLISSYCVDVRKDNEQTGLGEVTVANPTDVRVVCLFVF